MAVFSLQSIIGIDCTVVDANSSYSVDYTNTGWFLSYWAGLTYWVYQSWHQQRLSLNSCLWRW